MPGLKVPTAVLPAFAYAISTTPEGVPHRWRKIRDYVRAHMTKLTNFKLSLQFQV